MWDIASTTAQLATAYADAGTILAVVIGTIVTAIVALVGLGFGIRKLKSYVTGRKF